MERIPFSDLKDKVCVLTGGGGVIGSVFAMGLAEAGVKIAILDFNKESAEKLAGAINIKFPQSAIGVFANVLDKDSLLAAKQEVNKVFGKESEFNI